MAPAQPFNSIGLIGLGLIGSSIARAVRAVDPTVELLAYDADPAVRARAQALGLAQMVETAAEAATAEFIILCAPVGAFAVIGAEISGSLKPGAIVSDVGSVKAAVYSALKSHLPANVHLVPAHPVAGTEKSGPDAGFASLFKNRWCILTPEPSTDDEAITKVQAFWESLGSNIEIMEAQHHDLVLAVTSHIPHLIAFTIVGTASDLETVTKSEVIKFSAGGFRDFTRIAASDPTMWRDVFLTNRDAVLEILQRFSEDLTALQRAIRWGEGDKLYNLFSRTRAIRRSIIDAGQDTAEEDFGRTH
jgi:cyclohexadieny/prephenate dehydrogenase